MNSKRDISHNNATLGSVRSGRFPCLRNKIATLAIANDYGGYIVKIELDQCRFDEGVGIFDVGCLLRDHEGTEIEIVKFSGYSEIDETDGTEYETISVHFDDGSVLGFDDFSKAVIRARKYEPVRPDWFVWEVKDYRGDPQDEGDAERRRQVEAERKAKAEKDAAFMRLHAEIRAQIPTRPVENYSDQELMAKISGAPLSVCEDVLIAYDCNLARMAGFSSKNMEKVKGIGKVRSEKIAAAFELGKRLARSHAQKDKITSPSDVAELMMSKMRYLQKEIVCVLCLDTKGHVTSKGTAGDLASDVTWGKMLGESTIFEGTLNASVFHPREIFRFAIEEGANSIVLVHNHPSGDPQPSQEDIRATKQLIEAGNHIGIKVLDHVVIGDGIFVSLKEEGFI